MAEASVTFAVGSEQVTVVLPVDLPAGGETIITGDFGGVVAAGTVARLRGSVRLTDNLHVRGTLLCDPTGVELDGQDLFDIHTHDGTLNLVGQEKTAWCRWGDTPVGWQVGDRLAVAPTATDVYLPSETTWQGTWASTTRLANSSDVTLPDGSIARPEVANLSQTVTLRNLKRIMVHEASAPNPQTLKWIRVLDSGEMGVLGHYPVHFHMIGDHARGSLIEGVVVENGKNHAFVPHASHGITFRNTVAYHTTGVAYWWDRPTSVTHTDNNTEDVLYDRPLAMWGVDPVPTVPGDILFGFELGAGSGNRIADAVATCIQGPKGAAGFGWPAQVNHNIGGLVWEFARNVAHNNKRNGTFTWQNDHSPHVVEDFVAYHNGTVQVEHGAYVNVYTYRRLVLMGGDYSFMLHALGDRDGPVTLEDIVADKPLFLPRHQAASTQFTIIRRCQFPQVIYRETFNGENWSWIRYEDCGLTPADFDLAEIWPTSLIEITEGGVLTHSWAGGWI